MQLLSWQTEQLLPATQVTIHRNKFQPTRDIQAYPNLNYRLWYREVLARFSDQNELAERFTR